MKTLVYKTTLLLFVAANASGQGTILWDESVNGPISNFSASPTQFGSLSLGTNSVIGQSEIQPAGNNWTVYEDIFLFSIPANSSLGAVFLSIDRPRFGAWVGDSTYSSQIGYTGVASNGDLLTQWQLVSLNSGSYGMYVGNYDNQPSTTIASYRLDFFVQPVPEPSAFSLLLVGAGLVGLRCWRKIHLTKN